jgi:hypothetical protein
LEIDSYTVAVDGQDWFAGYLYFPRAGTYRVYAYRASNACLYPYPKGTQIAVPEWSTTLSFTVHSVEDIPVDMVHLLPTRCVDAGVKYIGDYARYLTRYCLTDEERLKVLLHFLVFGDARGEFTYTYYDEMYPGYLELSYDTIFIASHFLVNRRGVCNDFAELYAALARSLGIKAKRMSGSESGSVGHEWNLVQLGTEWRHVDATWANNRPSRYREYAELYPEFSLATFVSEHDERFSVGLGEEW